MKTKLIREEGRKPSEEKVWQKHYAPGTLEQLQKKLPDETLWKLISTAMKDDNDEHDALVYFGRRIKRSTMLEEVEKWARVLKGMGLGVGDQILLFSPAAPESYYVLFAADSVGVTTIMPNMSASAEALKKYYAQSKVAFVFDGMESLLTQILEQPQFEHVVLMDVTPSMRTPLKQILGLTNWVKTRKTRNRNAKYMTMRQAIARFGNYEGLLPEKKGRTYTECDIDTKGKKSRGAKRIVFSNDGLIYYTEDHYESFELLYGEE